MKTFIFSVQKNIMNKTFVVLLALICCIGLLGGCSSQQSSTATSDEAILQSNLSVQKECIQEQIKITLPNSAIIQAFSDTHGGFLGDGLCYARVKIKEDYKGEIFMNAVADKWTPLSDVDNIITSAIGVYIPEVQNGYGFYRDRYFEQYGKEDYLQNYTIAVFDTDKNILYMYASDM